MSSNQQHQQGPKKSQPENTQDIYNFSLMMGNIQARVQNIELEMNDIQKDVREVRDTVTGVKGSWKALLAVGSILSGIFVTIGIKLWDLFVSTGAPK